VIAKNRGRVLLVAAMVFVAPTLAWGSGFALFEVGGRSGGMAGTMVAVGDDLSTLFWNPAGMAFQTDEGVQLMFGTTIIQPEQDFTGSSPYPGDGYTASQVKQTFYPAHIFLGIPVNDRLEVSFAFHSPFGLGTEWEEDFLGRYISKKADLMVFDLGVSMAYKMSEKVAFGIGVDYMTTFIELTRNVGLINPFNQDSEWLSRVRRACRGVSPIRRRAPDRGHDRVSGFLERGAGVAERKVDDLRPVWRDGLERVRVPSHHLSGKPRVQLGPSRELRGRRPVAHRGGVSRQPTLGFAIRLSRR
jgi:long-subunit fatty acid transport protein